MNLKKAFSKLLHTKWVLHLVALLSLLTVIGYGIMNKLNAVALFIIISLLVFYFSKNMIIVLGVPLILVNLFVSMHVIKEGMETNSSSSSSSSSSSNPITSTKSNSDSPAQKKAGPAKRTSQGLPTTSVNEESEPIDESFEVGRAKQTGGYNIDYASTMEDAYSELNKIIGGGGMKKLTSDTQNLMKQQVQLAEAMKGMGPLIQGMAPLMQQAQGLLSGLKEGDGVGGGLGGIVEMAKKFTAGQQMQQQQ